jgi:hypothetical protein
LVIPTVFKALTINPILIITLAFLNKLTESLVHPVVAENVGSLSPFLFIISAAIISLLVWALFASLLATSSGDNGSSLRTIV